jgi:hypothetical protein
VRWLGCALNREKEICVGREKKKERKKERKKELGR